VRNAEPGDAIEVMVLGHPHRATILHEPPFDPKGEQLRAQLIGADRPGLQWLALNNVINMRQKFGG